MNVIFSTWMISFFSRIKELNEDQYIMNIDDPDAEICTIGDVLDMVM